MVENDSQVLQGQFRKPETRSQKLVKEIAVPKQTMEARKLKYKTDITRLAEQIAKRARKISDGGSDCGSRDCHSRFPGVPVVTN